MYSVIRVRDFFESVRRESVKLSGTTADNVIRLNLRTSGVFILFTGEFYPGRREK